MRVFFTLTESSKILMHQGYFQISFSQNNLDSGVFYSWWLAAVCHAVLLNDP